MTYLIIAQTCDGCGGKVAVKMQQTEPTPEEIEEVKDSLGSMFCIRSYTTSAEMGFIAKVKDE